MPRHNQNALGMQIALAEGKEMAFSIQGGKEDGMKRLEETRRPESITPFRRGVAATERSTITLLHWRRMGSKGNHEAWVGEWGEGIRWLGLAVQRKIERGWRSSQVGCPG